MRLGGVNDVIPGSVGWGFWDLKKSQLVEFLPPNERVEIQSWARPDEFVRYGHRALVGLRADDVKAVSIERLCVSLSSCRKTFYSKVIKGFVPELRSRKVFRVYFGFPMSISHIRILWVCYTADLGISILTIVRFCKSTFLVWLRVLYSR